MVKVGDKIRIIYMEGEPQYTFKEGVVLRINDEGQLYGTWGRYVVIPELDVFEILNRKT